MIEIRIKQVNDGYHLEVKGSSRDDGNFVRKNTEEFSLLQKIGRALLDYDIKVERR